MNFTSTNISPRVVVIGGGSAGISVISSLKKRLRHASFTVIEPEEYHYYQPAWTLVGGGIFDINKTKRPMHTVIPSGVEWCKDKVSRVMPAEKYVLTEKGKTITYDFLIVASGLVLRWDEILGLEETLGKNGVTSNYHFDLAEYTWHLVKELRQGKVIFSQPLLPIKCAGAPQKALYLSCDHWRRIGVLQHIEVSFCLAGKAIFGVTKYVPPLQQYLEKYQATVNFSYNLTRVDGAHRLATFSVSNEAGDHGEVTLPFDILHVVPPQSAPAFIKDSDLSDSAGWCDVNKYTLQHNRWPDIFAAGDCCSTPNAKTAAAARKQVVVVAENITALIRGKHLVSRYDGYGSCPLTVERGKVILAEFGYDGKLLPTVPFINSAQPRRLAWWLKTWFLPRFYWAGMLRGIEWFARSKS